MKFTKAIAGALLLAATATPAFAQDQTDAPDAFTITGGATVVSDYRFRGFSQTGEDPTIQGTFTVTHESGLYLGVWGSGIDLPGYGGTEIDIYGGFAKEVASGLTADIGATLYLYPDTANSKIIEPYFALTGTVGPATIKGAVAWAPGGQDSLAGNSAVYIYSDVAVGIPNTPFKLKGHAGFAKSDSFLGGLDGDVFDYSVGVEATWKVLTLGVSYVNTDAPTLGGYKEASGADGAVLFTLGASF